MYSLTSEDGCNERVVIVGVVNDERLAMSDGCGDGGDDDDDDDDDDRMIGL